jgi:ASC-1-like (ASCH) protein
MKYFVVSDIHGHASILKEELEKSGFDPEKEDHMLIVCGDCFDRGRENRATLSYLQKIKNKVLIRGNHEEMLMKVIERGGININNIYNGTDITAEEFFGEKNVSPSGEIKMSYRSKKQIVDFIESTVDYYETEHYVFVHGWIPEGVRWRRAGAEAWSRARWTGWCTVENKNIGENKTVVCGHRSARYAADVDNSRRADDYTVYFGDGFIAIDGSTVVSGRVNVLELEDEPLQSLTHAMRLDRKFFDLVAKGAKKIEMRLFDEKRREIRVGDKIVFTANDGTGETVETVVEGTYVYPSFDGLAYDFKPSELGFRGRDPEYIKEFMTGIYGMEKIRKYGAMAIKIRLDLK